MSAKARKRLGRPKGTVYSIVSVTYRKPDGMTWTEWHPFREWARAPDILGRCFQDAEIRGETVVAVCGYYASRGKSGGATVNFPIYSEGVWVRTLEEIARYDAEDG